MRADIIQRAIEVSRDVLRVHASDVDQANRFPRESIGALHDAGLLALMVPASLGGLGGDMCELAEVSAVLGEECLSTALIWAMHSQQVALIGRHAPNSQLHFLERVVKEGALVASVTSEPGRGADVWSSSYPVIQEGSDLRVRRPAPIVSYGAEAQLFLVKMLSAEGRPPSDVVMVLVTRADGDVRIDGDWNSMGMKGTRSIPMSFDVVVGRDRILGPHYRNMALDTMVPVGYVAWSAAWLGAARGRFHAFIRALRERKVLGGRNLNSELLKHRLARARLKLDLVDALLQRVVNALKTLDTLREDERHARQDESHFILLNNLKVASSELGFAVVSELVEMAGMRHGYLQGETLGLERVLRDLRSASLMYHNDQLLGANGAMILVEGRGWGQIYHAGSSNPTSDEQPPSNPQNVPA